MASLQPLEVWSPKHRAGIDPVAIHAKVELIAAEDPLRLDILRMVGLDLAVIDTSYICQCDDTAAEGVVSLSGHAKLLPRGDLMDPKAPVLAVVLRLKEL